MDTAIIVVNYRTPWHLDLCLQSVFKHTQNFHLFLVQNSPDNKSLEVGEKFKKLYPEKVTVIVNEKNLGYVGGVNSAYTEAMKYERVCLLNSDIIVSPGWLDAMNKVLDENPDVVQVYPDTNSHYPDQFIWKLVKKLPMLSDWLYQFHANINPPRSSKRGFEETKEFYWSVGGYCNLFRAEFFRDLGYFLDTGIVHGYWDDFDLAYYLRQFGKVGTCYDSYVFHFLNTSFKKTKLLSPSQKEQLAFWNGMYIMHKWRERISAELADISTQMVGDLTLGSEVVKMFTIYKGLVAQKADTIEFIRSRPAMLVAKELMGQ